MSDSPRGHDHHRGGGKRSVTAEHRAHTHAKPRAKPPRTKLARAKIRHFLFSLAPDRLLRGRLKKRHLEQEVHLREMTLRVPHWPEAWDGLRIGHLSDLHLGDLMPVDRAIALVERLGKAKPDLLACTGDLVDLHWSGAEPVLEAMAAVPAPLGHYFVLGNHDHLDDPGALEREAAECGLTVLNDRCIDLFKGRDRLRVGGIDWARTRRDLAKRISAVVDKKHHAEERPDLLLSHNPKAFPAAARCGIPLTLSGHTHGGQVGLPGRRDEERVGARRLRRGVYAEGPSRLFVTVGAGSWFPARVNCPAELLMLTITR